MYGWHAKPFPGKTREIAAVVESREGEAAGYAEGDGAGAQQEAQRDRRGYWQNGERQREHTGVDVAFMQGSKRSGEQASRPHGAGCPCARCVWGSG